MFLITENIMKRPVFEFNILRINTVIFVYKAVFHKMPGRFHEKNLIQVPRNTAFSGINKE